MASVLSMDDTFGADGACCVAVVAEVANFLIFMMETCLNRISNRLARLRHTAWRHFILSIPLHGFGSVLGRRGELGVLLEVHVEGDQFRSGSGIQDGGHPTHVTDYSLESHIPILCALLKPVQIGGRTR